MKSRAFASPGKYIQGYDEMAHLSQYTADFGREVFVVITKSLYRNYTAMLKDMYKDTGSQVTCVVFGGEATVEELYRLTALAVEAHCDVVVGIGGGKVMDAAKYVGIHTDSAMVICPTVVSTDAPTSGLSVTYTAEGVHSKTLYYKRNPDLVLVDSKIITQSPLRLFVSGMGDALSTWFEAKAHGDTQTKNRIGAGFAPTLAAMELSQLCYEVLLRDGVAARDAVAAGECNEAVENIIEVNTLLSGIGVESVGCAGAHSLNSGFTALPACRVATHGEVVAFGTLCELVLEAWPQETVDAVLDFCGRVGLPITLAEIGLGDATPEDLQLVASRTCKAAHIVAEPVSVDEAAIIAAIRGADALGQAFHQRHQ